jgi:HEAT repeat protein
LIPRILVVLLPLLVAPLPAQAAASRTALATVVDGGAPIGKRTAAARALGRSRDPRAVPVLIRAFGSRDERFTDALIAALQNLKATPLLVTQLMDPATAPEDRLLAARGLRYLRGEEARPALLKALEAQETAVKVEAILALDLMGAPEAADRLILLMKGDPDDDVRYHAAENLGHIRTPAVKTALQEQLRAEKDQTVRYAVKQALRQHEAAAR